MNHFTNTVNLMDVYGNVLQRLNSPPPGLEPGPITPLLTFGPTGRVGALTLVSFFVSFFSASANLEPTESFPLPALHTINFTAVPGL